MALPKGATTKLVTLVGWKEALAKVKKWPEEAHVAMSEAVYQEALREFEMTQELVPVDTGALKASGQVKRTQMSGRIVASGIIYGGGEVDYAIPVHEDLLAYHKVGQAKYVEDVVRREFGSQDAIDYIGGTFERLMAEYTKTGYIRLPGGRGIQPTRGRPKSAASIKQSSGGKKKQPTVQG